MTNVRSHIRSDCRYTVVLYLAINPCSEHLCTQLCLLSGLRPRYYTCHCQSGWKLDADKRTCIKGMGVFLTVISYIYSYAPLFTGFNLVESWYI